eukprot:gene10663-3287_t
MTEEERIFSEYLNLLQPGEKDQFLGKLKKDAEEMKKKKDFYAYLKDQNKKNWESIKTPNIEESILKDMKAEHDKILKFLQEKADERLHFEGTQKFEGNICLLYINGDYFRQDGQICVFLSSFIDRRIFGGYKFVFSYEQQEKDDVQLNQKIQEIEKCSNNQNVENIFFEKFECGRGSMNFDVKTMFLLPLKYQRFIKENNSMIELNKLLKHHNNYLDDIYTQGVAFNDLTDQGKKNLKHSERMITYTLWRIRPKFNDKNVAIIYSTSPSCHVCMAHLKKFFDSYQKIKFIVYIIYDSSKKNDDSDCLETVDTFNHDNLKISNTSNTVCNKLLFKIN